MPIGLGLGTAIAGAAGAGASIWGAQEQSSSAQHAADLQAQAANNALAFQKDQAALDAQRANATQQANYQQWAAREGRLSSLGELVGLPSRQIPAYQPMPLTTQPDASASGPVGPALRAAQQGLPAPAGAVSTPSASTDPQQIVQSLIQSQNLVGHQADPNALVPIVTALQKQGINATLDTRTDGLHKGIMLNGQFIKLLNGSDQWIYQPASGATAPAPAASRGNAFTPNPSLAGMPSATTPQSGQSPAGNYGGYGSTQPLTPLLPMPMPTQPYGGGAYGQQTPQNPYIPYTLADLVNRQQS